MSPFVESAILTSLIYIFSILMNQRLKAHNIFFIFFAFAGIGFLLENQAHAFTYDTNLTFTKLLFG